MTIKCLYPAAAAAILVSGGAVAHHSFAMFDNSHTVTVQGTVKDWQWTNPHTWIVLMVMNEKTQQLEEWGLEGLPTPGMARRGWSRKALKVGDKIEVDIYPLKNGANGGAIVKARADGREIGSPPPT
ncbi:MAG: DUF6152 family protein [Pseudomonadota bacterium]|nr:DUF6152 family protein [Pseudomonadota bacterium]